MKDPVDKLSCYGRMPPRDQEAGNAERQIVQQRERVADYKKGDLIGGRHEVHDILGKGGFGVVYLVEVRETGDMLALKTFSEEFLDDSAARDAFKKEALLWVSLDAHPFVLTAEWVDEVSGRLFVAMEYIAPDTEGRVSLADHLARAVGPIDVNQALKWAIQFCLGMEHACAHGIASHRDIKPQNILIANDKTLKISDFGLAAVAESVWRGSTGRDRSVVTRCAEDGFGLSLIRAGDKLRCGTPGYIAPEVYRCEGADIRSDIYSFGLVLWQMARGSRVPPFMVPWIGDMEGFLQAIYEQQMARCVPLLKDPLESIIECCLRPRPSDRFGSFQELREALEPIWLRVAEEKFEVPHARPRTAGYWSNKGAALKALGRHEEALRCYDKALAIDRRHATAWINKSISLIELGRYVEALDCCDKALMIAPGREAAWSIKGGALEALDRHEEALSCFDRALAINAQDAQSWYNKGAVHRAFGENRDPWARIGSFQEAMRCFDKALSIDPRHTNAWNEKGLVNQAFGKESGATSSYLTALHCFDNALSIDPLNVNAWGNKANTLGIVGLHEDALVCCDKALAIEPRNAVLWYTKALTEDELGHFRQAMQSYQKFVELAEPQYAQAKAYAKQRLSELESKEI